jgi:alkylation response protein AidB-like acyl-CoA dehydrogenase
VRPGTHELDATERAYIGRCEAFARDVIALHYRTNDRDNTFPAEVHEAALQAGILNAGFPRALGGQDLSHRALALGGLAMARICAPTTFTMGFNHGALRPYLRFGTPAQQQRFVADVVAARGYGSWCMTEPDSSGSDLLSMRTVAERVSGGYVLRGEKCMTGNGTVASVFAVLAEARQGEARLGPTIFAVPRGPQLEVSENTDKLGFRCLPTPTVRFDDVFVPDENVIGEVGSAVPVLLDSLDYMRFGGGIVILGLVDGALAEILPWLESRYIYGGERLLDTSHVQVTLGRLVARRRALDSLLFAVGEKLARDEPCREDAASLKLLASELAVHTTEATMQLHGWRGIDAREGTQKRFRDARQTTIYEGTSEIQAINLFRAYVREARRENQP